MREVLAVNANDLMSRTITERQFQGSYGIRKNVSNR
jgi:hypothetical protein